MTKIGEYSPRFVQNRARTPRSILYRSAPLPPPPLSHKHTPGTRLDSASDLNRYRWERIHTCLLRSCLLLWTWVARRPSSRWISTQWPWCSGRSFHVVKFQVITALTPVLSDAKRLLLAVFHLLYSFYYYHYYYCYSTSPWMSLMRC